jgi:DNA gyrase subunit A
MLIAIKNVNDDNDLVIINKSGIAIRLRVSSLRVVGRATQGVRLINLEKKNDEIASVCKVDTEPETTDEESVRDAFQNDALDTTQGENIQEAEQNENEQQNDNE